MALGFMSLAVLGMQPALTARLSWLPFSLGKLLRFHRHVTLLAVVAAFAHPALLFAADPAYRPLLDVVDAPLRAQLGWVSLAALLLLIISTVWRRALRLSYPVWQALHAAFGAVIVLAALAHALRVGYYTGQPWQLALWLAYGAAFLWLSVWVRLLRPMGRRPWWVAEVFPEPGGAVTIGLAPLNGQPLQHQAGQFAWLSLANPLRMDATPYTISSPPGSRLLEFTIKPVGPSSRAIREVRVGDRVYLDGPHGDFTVEAHPSPGYVFLATGVGVTPILSILSAMAERGDPRPCLLFLGNRSERDVPGLRRLARLSRWSNLQIVHVINRPSREWTGECGYIDEEVLRRFLPFHYRILHYFVCASPEVTRGLVEELQRLHVPPEQIHTEGFGFV